MSNVGYATISIIPDLKGFQSKLTEETRTATVGAGKSGGAGFGGAMIGTIGGLGIGLAVTKAFDIGKQVLDFDSGIQQATTALTTLLHSSTAANALVDQLEKLAQASSLLDTGSAVKLGQVLVGMGVPVKDVTTDMQALADATAGVGGTPETLDALARAWGQMAAKGKIQSDEILQMTEQGVPALQLLAKAYGVSTGEMSNMISKGQVMSSDALPKLRAEMEKGFGGADAAAGANSIGGAFDRIKEAAISLAGSAAMPLIKGLTPIIASMADALGSPKVQAFIDNIGVKLKSLFEGIGSSGGILSGAMSTLGPAFMHIVEAGQDLFTTLKPIAEQIFEVWKKDIGPNLIPVLGRLMTLLGDFIQTISIVVEWWWKVFGPSFLTALDVTYKAVVKIVNAIIDIFEGLFEIIQGLFTGDWSLVWQGVKDVFKGVWDAIVAIFDGVVGILGAGLDGLWSLIKELFGGLAAWFVSTVWDPIKNAAVAVWDAITGAITGAWDLIKDTWNGVVAFFADLWNGITSAVSNGVSAIVSFFEALPGQILNFLTSLPGMAIQGLKDLAFAFGYGIGLIWKEILAFPGQVVDLFTGLWHDVVNIATSLWNDLVAGFEALVTAVVNEVEALPGQIAGFFTDLWHTVTTIATNLWNDVTGWFKRMATDAYNFVSGLPGKIAKVFSDLWTDAKQIVATGINDVTTFFSDLPGKITNALSGLGTVVKDACKDAIHWLEDAGKAIIDGLINGIKGAWHKVTDLIGGLGHAISSGFKAAIDSHSPSKVFAEHGRNIVEGVVVGVTGSQHEAIGAVHQMGINIANAFSNGGPVGIGAALSGVVSGGNRTLNYYANGGGLSSEDELFAAAGRARMVW